MVREVKSRGKYKSAWKMDKETVIKGGDVEVENNLLGTEGAKE